MHTVFTGNSNQTFVKVPSGILLKIQKLVGTRIVSSSYLFSTPSEAKAFAASSFA